MHIDGNILTAESDMALRRVGTDEPTTITRVCLSASDAAVNWEDCDYGVPQPDPETEPATEQDKDDALSALGVDMEEQQ